ncbi:MAG: efflux RND transporter periplasmic adaptor subunit [Anaerolineales bacterium]|uniref:HlyD family secretion protein n=1 Tax=Candidatus Villigracilis proximus TaxID=3140683 RepID=UPI0031359BA6|nr:efflux RND transporter periplasmic adaptor subunit [Anaerolineales bacterium]
MKYIKLITLSLLALMIAACGTATATPEATPIPTVIADTTIISEGRLEPVHYTELALNANGLISEVLKVEGDTVAAGDVIARLKSNEAQTLEAAQAKAAQELTTAYQEVRDAQFKLDNFDVPTDFAGMTPPESVAAMLVNLDKARADFEPYKDINDRNLQLTDAQKRGQEVVTGTAKIFKKALDDAWTRYRKAIQWMELESAAQNANSRLVLAQRDYDALQDPTFAEDTAGTRAALANAEVRAPFPGVITDLQLKVGEFEASGQPVVTIADTTQWVVKTKDLTEIDVVNIKEGQSVTVKFDALPGVEFKGNVLSVSDNFSENQGDVVYEVTILLTDVDPAMRWGMTAVVTFEQ